MSLKLWRIPVSKEPCYTGQLSQSCNIFSSADLLKSFQVSIPGYQALPDFIRQYNYQNTTGGKCAWQKAANTDLDFFPWARQHPEVLKWFQGLMSVPRSGNWLDVVPFDDTLQSKAFGNRPVFVDIGGSIGHQCARLISRYPKLSGRIILQDLPETIRNAPPINGVKAMVHDFFKPQPIKGKLFP
jgi:demethylsterigmatocystin 6-O-methyltransferase